MNPAVREPSDRICMELKQLAAKAYTDTVFGVEAWKFTAFHEFLRLFATSRIGVWAGLWCVVVAQLIIFVLKIGGLTDHWLIASWSVAIMFYSFGWIVFRVLRNSLARHILAASDELMRNDVLPKAEPCSIPSLDPIVRGHG